MLPRDEWTINNPSPSLAEVWVSRDHLAMIYHDTNLPDGWERLSINRTLYDPKTDDWAEGITWEALMVIKLQIGRGDRDALEAFPAHRDIVCLAAMRHLWVLPDDHGLPCFWRRRPAQGGA